jgi:4-hydroxy-3-methylbut-2-enyl diphosphate reductase
MEGTMEITRIKPSGYCYGVVNAINVVLNAIKSEVPKPITIYGMLIHNKNVIDSLSSLGVNTIIDPSLSDLDNLEGTIIFTAHGIRESVIEYAKQQGLHVINATCRDVTNTINLIKDYVHKGYEVLYIGKEGHPEATATTDFRGVQLITKREDLSINPTKKYVITNQTTMSMLDLFDIYEHAKTFPNIEVMNEICNATRRRQEAVLEHLDKELLIVVGDTRSNNSNNLAKLHPNGVLIETYKDLKNIPLNYSSVAVTAGASTPKLLVDEVVEYLEQYPKIEDFKSTKDYQKIVTLK